MKMSSKFAKSFSSQCKPWNPKHLSRSSQQHALKKLSSLSVYNQKLHWSWSCNHLLILQKRQIHLQHFTNTKDQINNTQWNKHDFENDALPVDPLTASKHLTELINKGLHEEAEAKFELLCRSKLVNNITWNTWLTYIGKHYDLTRLLAEYQKMKLMSVQPSFITYSILILNCCKYGDIQLALKLLSTMSRYWKPNAAIYNAFIKSYLDQHDYSKAREFYEKMLNAGVLPDSGTHRLLLNLFIALKDSTSVRQIAQEVLKSSSPPQLQTMITLITACVTIHDGQLALDGLRRMISNGKLRDTQTLFTPFITAAIEHNQLDFLTLCLAVLKNRYQTQAEEHLLIQILNAYLKNAKIKESIDILLMIEGFQWTVQLTTSFFAYVKSILQQKSPSEGLESLLQEMELFVDDQKGEDGMATLRSRSFKQFRDIITKLQSMPAIQNK